MITYSGVKFVKMHGLGNDFVFIDNSKDQLLPEFMKAIESGELVRRLSHRKRGVGFDQLMILEAPRSDEHSVFMRIFNADGSEVGACGNAARCLGGLLYRNDGVHDHTIGTLSGNIKVLLQSDGNVKVNMGRPVTDWRLIPLAYEVDPLFVPIDIAGMPSPVAVSMGNPHLVFFCDDVDLVDIHKVGPELERHALFNEGTNVEFVQIESRSTVRMRVWERGTGVTESCASGACAVVAAGVMRGELDSGVLVKLDGGELQISYDDTVEMVGPVSFVYEGFLSGE